MRSWQERLREVTEYGVGNIRIGMGPGVHLIDLLGPLADGLLDLDERLRRIEEQGYGGDTPHDVRERLTRKIEGER